MASSPTTREVTCPHCKAIAVAVVPARSTIVEQEESFDGKVWVNCESCDESFLVHYRNDS